MNELEISKILYPRIEKFIAVTDAQIKTWKTADQTNLFKI